jgi:hypothetical protein
MDRLDVGWLSQTVRFAPDGEFGRGSRARPAPFRIAYVGGEEFDVAAGRVWIGREQRGDERPSHAGSKDRALVHVASSTKATPTASAAARNSLSNEASGRPRRCASSR